MNLLYVCLVILLAGLISASSFERLRDVREEVDELMSQLRKLESSERSGIKKYVDKLVKSFEKSSISSKSSTSIGELKESYQKYSDKIFSKIKDLTCSEVEQVRVLTLLETFLNDFKEKFNLDEKVSTADDIFIDALRKYPNGSIASHYIELWNTLNELEGSNGLSHEDLAVYIDNAVENFTSQFVNRNREEFSAELADEVIAKCLFAGYHSTFNRAIEKISKYIPHKKNEDDDDDDEEEESDNDEKK